MAELDSSRRRALLLMAGALGVSTLGCAGVVVLGTRVPAVAPVYSSCEGAEDAKRVLVAYGSMYGSTGEVAEAIGERLCYRGLATDVLPIEEAGDPSLYDAVVLGSAVQGGRWLPRAIEYVQEHRAALSQKPLAVFCTHLLNLDDTGTSRSRRAAYLEPVRALVTPGQEAYFAGKLGPLPLPGHLALKLAGIPEGDRRDWQGIRAWAEQLFPDQL
ncbi:MAG: flavodoxin [Anaerolineae bacterium]|nr:flavodoxin [Anaerolineae bacterium]